MKADWDCSFWKPFVQSWTNCCSKFYDLEKFFVIPYAISVWYTFLFCNPGKIYGLWLPPMKCRVFFRYLGVFFVTWVNILSNMLILIVVMETTRTNHKNFQVVLHWHSYMPQQNDNHLRMIIMLQWHIADSFDQVIAWDHIITISIQSIINIK